MNTVVGISSKKNTSSWVDCVDPWLLTVESWALEWHQSKFRCSALNGCIVGSLEGHLILTTYNMRGRFKLVQMISQKMKSVIQTRGIIEWSFQDFQNDSLGSLTSATSDTSAARSNLQESPDLEDYLQSKLFPLPKYPHFFRQSPFSFRHTQDRSVTLKLDEHCLRFLFWLLCQSTADLSFLLYEGRFCFDYAFGDFT